jgi:thiamine biosynthesis lipoprotein
MGVEVRLTVYALEEQHARDACRGAFWKVAMLEDVFSDYRPDSTAMRLCRAPVNEPVHTSPTLFFVLENAIELSQKSDGAFDVTVGPYVQLWRAARKSKRLPTTQELDRAQSSVGCRYVKLDNEHFTAAMLRPGMRLDFGGIAKGYAGDEAIKTLRENGISRALFEAGGDIVAGNAPPGKKGWTIQIDNAGSGVPRAIELENAAISTSGDTMQFVEIDGVRYSHVVDPRTGQALTNHYVATVIAPKGITSDSLSTACCVLGPEEGAKLVKEYVGVTAYIRHVDQ